MSIYSAEESNYLLIEKINVAKEVLALINRLHDIDRRANEILNNNYPIQ
jgi:hypothetical protein